MLSPEIWAPWTMIPITETGKSRSSNMHDLSKVLQLVWSRVILEPRTSAFQLKMHDMTT